MVVESSVRWVLLKFRTYDSCSAQTKLPTKPQCAVRAVYLCLCGVVHIRVLRIRNFFVSDALRFFCGTLPTQESPATVKKDSPATAAEAQVEASADGVAPAAEG